MNIFGHLRVWISVLMLLVIALPALVPADQVARRVHEEAAWATEAFGQERMNRIVERANGAWHASIVSSGLQGAISSKPETEGGSGVQQGLRRSMGALYDMTSGYLASLSNQLYAVFLRGAILVEWFSVIGVFLAAACVDGYTKRRVKIATGGLSSPVMFSWASHAMIAIALSPIVYILMPVAVSPMFMPWWAMIIVLPLSLAITNAVRIR